MNENVKRYLGGSNIVSTKTKESYSHADTNLVLFQVNSSNQGETFKVASKAIKSVRHPSVFPD